MKMRQNRRVLVVGLWLMLALLLLTRAKLAVAQQGEAADKPVLQASQSQRPAELSEAEWQSVLAQIEQQHSPERIDTAAQQAYLKASNTGADDQFGFSVALSGDTLVVGAPYEDSNATGVNGVGSNNEAVESGAAYVFVRSGSTWSQQAYLKAANTEAFDNFGISVALSGDTLVVGAYGEDSNAMGVNVDGSNNSANGSGAAYVFVRSGSTWSQQAYLKASNTGAGDWFGYSVALSGDTLVVGAVQEASNATGVNGDQSNNSAGFAGAAYVFVRSGLVIGGTWSQQAYLKASNTGASDWFGISVALSGDTLVVGAYQEDSNAMGVNGDPSNNLADSSGAAYVFVRSGLVIGGTWSQQAYLKAANTEAGDLFGFSVALSGDTLVVGAYQEDSNATGVNGDGSNNLAGGSGAAYVFVRSGSTWSQQAYLKASNTRASDQFGISVALSGDTLVVGALAEDSNATGVNGTESNNDAFAAGAAYVFVRSGLVIGGTWSQQAYLKASNTGASDQFGISVALSGDTLVVGANREDSNATGVNGDGSNNSASQSGAAYAFLLPSNVTAQIGKLRTAVLYNATANPPLATLGSYALTFSYTNNTNKTLRTLSYRVLSASNASLLNPSDGTPGGVGETISVADNTLPGDDSRWQHGEVLTDQQVSIGVAAKPWSLTIGIYAIDASLISGSSSGSEERGELLATLTFDSEQYPGEAEAAQRLFLPFIQEGE